MNDKQADNLWDWEKNVLPNLIPTYHKPKLTKLQIVTYTEYVCNRLGFDIPNFSFKKARKDSIADIGVYNAANWKINFFGAKITKDVILHEIAHMPFFHRKVEDHGKEFMGFYIKLLHEFLGIPLKKLKKSLNKASILYEE